MNRSASGTDTPPGATAGPRQAGSRSPRPVPVPVPWLALTVIATGGIAGALARSGLEAAFPYPAGSFDWTTFGINVAGCALIGVLMTALTEVWHAHRLVGLFVGTGMLGGFTTFSAYVVGIQKAITARAPLTGLAYLAVTLICALLAVYAAAKLTRLAARPHRKDRP